MYMEIFEFEHNGDKYEIACSFASNKQGFKHSAYLYIVKGRYREKVCNGVTIQYYNKAWERYTYESVISEILSKSKLFTDSEREELLDKFNIYI